MSALSLSMAGGPYDRTEALRAGTVRPEGISLSYVAIQSSPEIFRRMIEDHEFDVAEMSCSVYLTLKSQGNLPFVALPVFPSRVFRHGFIFINTEAGIGSPKGLEGKRVGLPGYSQTASVWIRGILQHEYGVSLDSIHWFEGGLEAPRRRSALDVKPEGPLSIEFIENKSLNEMLVAGELDALIAPNKPSSLGSPQVQRLFPNYRQEERRYYEKTGIFPIMHTMILKQELYDREPWVAQSIYRAMVESKRRCMEDMRYSGALRYALPWLFSDLEEMDEVFGEDPWPDGLEANRKTVETLMGYLVEQYLMPRHVSLDSLFAPVGD